MTALPCVSPFVLARAFVDAGYAASMKDFVPCSIGALDMFFPAGTIRMCGKLELGCWPTALLILP